ncbi:DUF4254 domain-containing protein [Nocardia mangyaensis]|uniref:DUF4254 domain-containing protein n=1 Tax=Nocardia mangyaensis TaxID=2213200 RepID=UPI0026753C70|nr:DUF4254 domain-containing protein [Nocardia mangyaensis]MDO3649713.1 DUF4254 domain-containing protein [Nocardia mangyaensis]
MSVIRGVHMTIDPGHRVDDTQLPPPSALLRAFLAPHPDPTRHRVLDAASGLARCHDRRRAALETARQPGAASGRIAESGRLIDDIDDERAALIARIDGWVATNIAHRAGASLHTETLGAVIDRMAAKWVAAKHTLDSDPMTTTAPRQREARAHLQWCRLAELTDGYRDLITDVTERRRRLPVW